jgi:nucleoside-diphosphate-sugar epimerase
MQDAHTIGHLVDVLNDLLGTELEPIKLAPRPGDVAASLADITLAQRLLGYSPSVDFESGLRRTVDFISNSQATSPIWALSPH